MPKAERGMWCSGTHVCSCTSGPDGTFATPFRVYKGKDGRSKHLLPPLHGKKFKDSDAAFAAMHAQGMGEQFMNRSSVVTGCFRGLDFMERQALFDAKYRLLKWMRRQIIR